MNHISSPKNPGEMFVVIATTTHFQTIKPKMPLFGNKFSPKKTPARKNNTNNTKESLDDLVHEHRLVQLQLGEARLSFENGEWIPGISENGQTGSAHKSNAKLRRKIQSLEEENNLLRVKYEIMLNMLTQTTAESHIQEREIDKLRKTKK